MRRSGELSCKISCRPHVFAYGRDQVSVAVGTQQVRLHDHLALGFCDQHGIPLPLCIVFIGRRAVVSRTLAQNCWFCTLPYAHLQLIVPDWGAHRQATLRGEESRLMCH